MGSSKTAQALMCRFNYMQKGYKVLLAKPEVDTRSAKVTSRIGLEAECEAVKKEDNFFDLYNKILPDIIIVDECQFLTETQVEQLKDLTEKVPVVCYGLLTNFQTRLFEGSKRLVELADDLEEIPSICKCGAKAKVNARFIDGHVVHVGPEVMVGAEDRYEARCYHCFKKEK